MKKLKESIDEYGRKFYLAQIAIRFFGFSIIAAIAKASVPGLGDLDLATITAASVGVGGLVSIYAGANAWASHAEARKAEAGINITVHDEEV